MMTLSLLAGSFPQGPLIWRQLSFPEDEQRPFKLKIHTDMDISHNNKGGGGVWDGGRRICTVFHALQLLYLVCTTNF